MDFQDSSITKSVLRPCAFVIATLISLAIAHAAYSAELQQYWQLTYSYTDSGLRVIEAGPIPAIRKAIKTPGLTGAPVKLAYTIDWLDAQGNVLVSSSAMFPIGQRSTIDTDGPCAVMIPDEATFVVRLPGPQTSQTPSSVRMTRLSQLSSNSAIQLLPPAFEQDEMTLPIERLFDVSQLPAGPVGVEKIRDVGPDNNRLVIVVLGDGYTAANLANGDFENDAADLANAFLFKQPWDELFAGANIYRIDIESNEEGADQAGNVGGAPPGTFVDTYLNSSYWVSGIERLLAINSQGSSRAFSAANSLVGNGIWDHIFVLVNHTKYGGSGGSIAVSSVHSSASEIVLHEFGHTYAGLADEYETPYPGFPPGDGEPNVDFDFSGPGLKWLHWVESGTPLPTPETSPWTNNFVGAFEGARYLSTGIYRPWHNCLMRSLSRPFCPVCVEANVLTLLSEVDLVDDVQPPTGGGQQYGIGDIPEIFGVTPQQFPALKFAWTLDGSPLPDTTAQVAIFSGDVSQSGSDLELLISYISDKVRKDTVTEQYSWSVFSEVCCQLAGNADGAGGVTIADVTYLIARIFNGGPAPGCCSEGDADGGGTISIADVTYLVNYIFLQGSPAPICGPASMGC